MEQLSFRIKQLKKNPPTITQQQQQCNNENSPILKYLGLINYVKILHIGHIILILAPLVFLCILFYLFIIKIDNDNFYKLIIGCQSILTIISYAMYLLLFNFVS